MVISRCSGDEWLVTGEEVEEYTPQVGIVSNILQFISIEKYFFLNIILYIHSQMLITLTFPPLSQWSCPCASGWLLMTTASDETWLNILYLACFYMHWCSGISSFHRIWYFLLDTKVLHLGTSLSNNNICTCSSPVRWHTLLTCYNFTRCTCCLTGGI